jgi:hypothetical protein
LCSTTENNKFKDIGQCTWAIKAYVHWQSLLPKTSSTDDRLYVLALATLGGTTKNRNDPISVELPKAPKITVTVTGVIAPNFAKGNIIKVGKHAATLSKS